MRFQTPLARRLGMSLPVIQAPMAGGATTVELVAAVDAAGGLGFLGAAYNTPEQIAELSRELRRSNVTRFGINLFAPQPRPPETDPAPMVEAIAAYHAELGLPPPTPPSWDGDPFDEQLEAVLESGASALSFTFGTVPAEAAAKVSDNGMLLIGTATTVAEAQELERLGVDAIVTQGSEAGAHRGTFATAFESAMIGTMALVPQVVDAVDVPVVASGGIMDGRGVAAALALGAQAAQLGTAFLTCHEAGIPAAHKEAILAGNGDGTTLTRAFSGRPARGLVNRFIREIETVDAGARLLPFPLQNRLTRDLRRKAGQEGRSDLLSLWAGQGLGMARRLAAGELLSRISSELAETVDRLGSDGRSGLERAIESQAVDQ